MMVDLVFLAIILGLVAVGYWLNGDDPRTKAGRKRGRNSRENP